MTADSAIATIQSDSLSLDAFNFEPPPPDTRQRLLRFRLTDQDSGLLVLEEIAEVLQIPPTGILTVPGVPDEVLGVLNWRGDMLWLVDLNMLTGYPSLVDQPAGLTTLIVLVIQARGRAVGLGVSQFEEVELHDLTHLQPVASGLFPSKLYHFIAGALPGDRGVVLRADSILQCALWQPSKEQS
ncbi:MAG: chemotaxis protein CheW [Elainellaceae cyanobacterium]